MIKLKSKSTSEKYASTKWNDLKQLFFIQEHNESEALNTFASDILSNP
jgi:hypothetical protein